ncbi:MAG TPA: iron ABC transporter permease, partial [Actinobacteria bacterium]|nr:iron ABC transporter permease [Actinomycetota bacterium]
EFARNSLFLSSATAALAVFLGLMMAYGGRLYPRTRPTIEFSAMGYAIPGAVVGVGVAATIAMSQGALNGILVFFGRDGGILLFGSLMALVYAYLVRFMAVAYRPVEASLGKVTPSMDMAARSLGASPMTTLRRIHAPLMGAGIIAGVVLVFVDVMKELPATLFLRPIGYDTLATRVWQFTAEALWVEASLPALTIVLAGVIPVAILIRGSRRVRDKRISSPSRESVKG